MNFRDYIEEISAHHGLIIDVDGTIASIRVTFPLGTNAHILYDKVNPNKRAYVRAGHFASPITRDGRQHFMNNMMEFNRNSIGTINAGIMPHPQNSELFTLTWYVPAKEQTPQAWDVQMGLFEQLALIANDRLKQSFGTWTPSLH